jgi:hypothetical protein
MRRDFKRRASLVVGELNQKARLLRGLDPKRLAMSIETPTASDPRPRSNRIRVLRVCIIRGD